MQQTVTVKDVKPNGKAVIQLQRMSACGHSCDGCHGCGAPNVILTVEANNPVAAGKGDKVLVESSNKTLYKAAVVVYLIPVVLFFLFYALGQWLLGKGALIGCLGFALGLGLAVVFNKRFTKSGGVAFNIVSVVERA